MTAPDKPGLSNEELKPCPFCGGSAIFKRNEPGSESCKVICVPCLVVGPVRATRKAAIEAWNRRAQSPPVAQGQQIARNELESLTGTGTNNPHKPQPKEPELINSACLQCREYELNDIPQLKDEFIKVMKYVEVYRRALERIGRILERNFEDHGVRDVTADMFKKLIDILIVTKTHANSEEALLTSKPEPVAPGRKWEAEEEAK